MVKHSTATNTAYYFRSYSSFLFLVLLSIITGEVLCLPHFSTENNTTMAEKIMPKRIGGYGLSNYYGGLYVTEHCGMYYWVIENHDTDFDNIDDWQECDKEIYDALIAYEVRTNQSTTA